MDAKASASAIIFCVISFILSAIVPVICMIYLAAKKKLNFKALAVGVFLYVVFISILEQLFHFVVLGSDYTKSFVYRHPVLFMLYGGLTAGLFEETARLVGFKFLLKVKDKESGYTGLSYGLGHGSFESVMTGGIVSVYNLITLSMINSGTMANMLSQADAETADSLRLTIETMTSTPAPNYLLTGVVRITSLIIQVALSLIVFKAVKEKKWKYFGYAILMHAIADFPAVLAERGIITNEFLCEMLIGFIAAAYAVFAYRICWQQQEQ